jgi:lipopolysaccharide transport system ATP-binding protein
MISVSHDLNSVRRCCDKALLLNKGNVAAYGDVNEVIDRYVYGAKKEKPAPQASKPDNKQRWGDLTVEITGVKFLDKNGGESGAFKSGDTMTARISFDSKRPVDNVAFGIMVYNESGTLCYGTNTLAKNTDLALPQGKGEIDLHVERLPMLEGKYFLTVAAHSKEHIPYDWHDRMYSFTVHNPTQDIGLFEVPCKWNYRAQ